MIHLLIVMKCKINHFNGIFIKLDQKHQLHIKMDRVKKIDQHFEPAAKVKRQPTLDVWKSMHLDECLSAKAIKLRDAVGSLMDAEKHKFEKHYEEYQSASS